MSSDERAPGTTTTGGQTASRATPRWAHLCLALAVTIVALGLRLHELETESLWIDEAITYARARLEPDALVRDSIRRKHIPTYFLFMHHWIPSVGDGEFALRLPSAIFGAATAGVGYAIGAVLAGPIAGSATGLLLACSRSQVHYGQEARMYAMETFFASLCVLALALLACARTERARAPWQLSIRAAPNRRALVAWLLLVLGTVGVLYLHNTAVLFVAAMQVAGATLLCMRSGARLSFLRNWLLCQGLSLLCWSPWIPRLISQSGTFDRWKQRGFQRSAAWRHVAEIIGLDQQDGPILWLLVGAAVLALVVPRAGIGRAWVMAVWLVSGLALCVTVSVTKANMMFVRTLLWTAIPAFAVVGMGLARLPFGSGLLGLACLMWLNSSTLHSYYQRETKPPWRAYLTELAKRTNNKTVIVNTGAQRLIHYYYSRKDGRLERRPIRYFNRQRRMEQIVGKSKRFWVVAKTDSGRTTRFQRILRKSGLYRRVFHRRRRSAYLAEYKRRRGR